MSHTMNPRALLLLAALSANASAAVYVAEPWTPGQTTHFYTQGDVVLYPNGTAFQLGAAGWEWLDADQISALTASQTLSVMAIPEPPAIAILVIGLGLITAAIAKAKP